MELILQIDGGDYPVEVKMVVDRDDNVIYCAEYVGSTISTFPIHKKFEGKSIEEPVGLIAKALKKAIQELLEQ